jgi:endonuclease G
MRDVFGEIYDVKRMAPGKVASRPAGRWYFTHDCSTLGGNSGSVVVDIDAGRAVGLHFGGAFRQANYAVTAPTIKQILGRLKVSVAALKPGERAAGDGAALVEAPPRKVEDYDDRFGYEPDFLGPATEHRVPLPKLPSGADAPDVKGAPAGARKVLRYTHFSLVLSKSRRLPIYTAVNIDGEQLRNIPRKGDAWYFDPRVDKDFQAGNDIYARNDLDRGHMVRRLDPVWGSTSEAKRANDDTFHFANACPQHKDLNQRTWNDLEDYILGNSGAHELKVCLFTGPVLEDDDPEYRGIRLPRQFWKVAVLVNDATGKLSTTAYMLSQASMIKDITEFVFGQYRTYQVPVARVEKLTGLRFGKVADFDPLKGQPFDEALAVGAPSSRVIEGPRDIVF